MSLSSNRKRALVTGGAGLIGSHLVDLLQTQGWFVRVFDNLEPQTHRNGKPPWLEAAIQNGAEFVEGDIRDREIVQSALDGIDIVFHEAAYGGYMPEISKYVAVNSLGTAQLLEIIREKNLGVRKIIVASSQVVYPEGAGECPQHGLVFPELRPVEQLRRGDFSVRAQHVRFRQNRYRHRSSRRSEEKRSMPSPRWIRKNWCSLGEGRSVFRP